MLNHRVYQGLRHDTTRSLAFPPKVAQSFPFSERQRLDQSGEGAPRSRSARRREPALAAAGGRDHHHGHARGVGKACGEQLGLAEKQVADVKYLSHFITQLLKNDLPGPPVLFFFGV